MLSTCLTIILTQIWHLAASLTCVGMRQWSQVNVLYYNYSTPGQTKAHAVLYSSQECVHNSFHMPRFCLPIMRQKKGIPFYSSALVQWWTSVSLKFSSNELFFVHCIIYNRALLAFWPCDLKKKNKKKKLSLFMASPLPYYPLHTVNAYSAKQILPTSLWEYTALIEKTMFICH